MLWTIAQSFSLLQNPATTSAALAKPACIQPGDWSNMYNTPTVSKSTWTTIPRAKTTITVLVVPVVVHQGIQRVAVLLHCPTWGITYFLHQNYTTPSVYWIEYLHWITHQFLLLRCFQDLIISLGSINWWTSSSGTTAWVWQRLQLQ